MMRRHFPRPMGAAEATGTVECGTCKTAVTVALYRSDPEMGGGLDLDAAHLAPDGTPCDLTEEEAEAALEQLLRPAEPPYDTMEEKFER